jgi:sulfite reductase (NADPH) flavoprotein alpha-component
VDLVAQALRECGCVSWLAEVGGELAGQGVKADGQPWWVALERPPQDDSPAMVVACTAWPWPPRATIAAMSIIEGQRYAHTIDPRTGTPVRSALASVTVLHRQCMVADALATVLTVLGEEAGWPSPASAGLPRCSSPAQTRVPRNPDPGPGRHAGVSMALQTRYLMAALVALTYLVFCVMTALTIAARSSCSRPSGARYRPLARNRAGGLCQPDRYGRATGLADRAKFAGRRHGGARAAAGQLTDADLQATRLALFVVSTTGEGDAPDMPPPWRNAWRSSDSAAAAPAFRRAGPGRPQLPAILRLRPCAARLAGRRHAQPLFDVIEVDNGDDGALRHWQHQLGVLSGIATRPTGAPRLWPLAAGAAALLNPGSAGGAVYHLQLTPLDLPAPTGRPATSPRSARATATRPWSFIRSWICRMKLNAGSGARQPLAAARGRSAAGLARLVRRGPARRLKPLPHRAYSIASLPADGGLELMVRLMHQPDGRAGIGSGWLGLHAAPGQEIDLRVRVNTAFHGPQDDRPLILIGNGTGLAGLRAHLRQRIAAGQRRNWLVFGERAHRHDFFHGEELQAWLAEGICSGWTWPSRATRRSASTCRTGCARPPQNCSSGWRRAPACTCAAACRAWRPVSPGAAGDSGRGGPAGAGRAGTLPARRLLMTLAGPHR